jgi:hypothetical protein
MIQITILSELYACDEDSIRSVLKEYGLIDINGNPTSRADRHNPEIEYKISTVSIPDRFKSECKSKNFETKRMKWNAENIDILQSIKLNSNTSKEAISNIATYFNITSGCAKSAYYKYTI